MKDFLRKLFRSPEERGIYLGRSKTRDISFQFRMGASFPGSVTRTHPANIEAAVLDATNPPLFYGSAAILDGTSHNARKVLAGDTAITTLFGIAVRPFPIQQAAGNATATIGNSVPPTTQPCDFLRRGSIMVPVVGNTIKGGVVYVWVAASGAGHTQGGFEAAATGGSTATMDGSYSFNGPQDANGFAEVIRV